MYMFLLYKLYTCINNSVYVRMIFLAIPRKPSTTEKHPFVLFHIKVLNKHTKKNKKAKLQHSVWSLYWRVWKINSTVTVVSAKYVEDETLSVSMLVHSVVRKHIWTRLIYLYTSKCFKKEKTVLTILISIF